MNTDLKENEKFLDELELIQFSPQKDSVPLFISMESLIIVAKELKEGRTMPLHENVQASHFGEEVLGIFSCDGNHVVHLTSIGKKFLEMNRNEQTSYVQRNLMQTTIFRNALKGFRNKTIRSRLDFQNFVSKHLEFSKNTYAREELGKMIEFWVKWYEKEGEPLDGLEIDIFLRQNERFFNSITDKYAKTEEERSEFQGLYGLAITKGLKKYSQETGVELKTYLYRCIVNEIFYFKRCEKGWETYLLTPLHPIDEEKLSTVNPENDLYFIQRQHSEEKGALERVLKEESLLQLKKIIKTLHPDEKEFVQDVFFKRKTQQEIANQLNCSQANVSKKYRSLMKKLKVLIEITPELDYEFDF